MPGKIDMLLIVAAVTMAGVRAAPGQTPASQPTRPLFIVEVAILREAIDETAIRTLTAHWSDATSYQKLAAAELLAKMLVSDQKLRTDHYQWIAGTHDLRQLGGRAAWAIEQLLKIKLTPVIEAIRLEEAKVICKQAMTAIEAYRCGLIDMNREVRLERSVKELSAAYLGKVMPGCRLSGDQVDTLTGAILQLFREWLPIGKSVADLHTILGIDSKLEEGQRCYVFDTGLGGMKFEIVEKDGYFVDYYRYFGLSKWNQKRCNLF